MTLFGGRTPRRYWRLIVVAAMALGLLLPASLLAGAATPPVRVAGFMPFGFESFGASAMAVDSVLHRGFYPGSDDRMYVYDLRKLRRIASFPITQIGSSFFVDERNHRIFYRASAPAVSCADSSIMVIDAQTFRISRPKIPCLGPSNASFYVRGLSYDARTNKLHVIGSSASEAIALQSSGISTSRESTIIRQLDADTFALDWEVDATDVCDTNTNIPGASDPVVGRARGGVISYCYVGGQGRAIWIPLLGDRPVVDANGATIVQTSPTVGRSTTPIIDAASGRLLILEDSLPFGPGVYVYNPEKQRFHGVVPSGVSLEESGVRYDYWRGFSALTGRLYIQNRGGLVIADVRNDPVPAGVSHPVLQNRREGVGNGPIAIDARLGRLFYPYPNRGGFVVVADDLPPPPLATPDDPDAGTADVPEVEGKTGRTFSGEASAFGAHLINVGGVSRLANNADPLCTSVSSVNDRDEFGRCPADRVITQGNREMFAAQSNLEAGLDSGAAALGALHRAPSSDSATDSDVRSVGRCAADRLPEQGAALLLAACPNSEGQALQPFTGGSQGHDGRGYPVPASVCTDFEGRKAQQSARMDPFGGSSASCDLAARLTQADADAGALRIATTDAVLMTVASASSSVNTRFEPARGVVTTATATVRGVAIAGQITIGSITTTATTRAFGRRGTTAASYEVDFFDVRGPGLRCSTCDPAQVAAMINRALGAQMRARVPAAFKQASPRGYQGVVSKDRGLLASDRAVNDDDTITVNGLDLIFYNDSNPANRNGSAGRSRVVVSLAGVQAESRYGIFLLPESSDGGFDSGTDDEEVEGTDGGVPAEVGGVKLTPPTNQPQVPSVTIATNPSSGAVLIRAFAFVRNRPGEFAMLFVLWSLLLSPVYLGLRRRALARTLGS